MLFRSALTFVLLCFPLIVHAQESYARSPSLAAASTPSAPAKQKEPMGVFSLGVKFGVAHVGTGDVDNPTYLQGSEQLPAATLEQYGLTSGRGCDPVDRRCHTSARRGYHLAIPIQLGGSGVGFRLEPYMTLGSGAQAYGAYMGPTFEFHVANPLYLGFGFGLKAAYVNADGWKYAADLYGRIPVWATLYVADNFALVAEFAFGAGASGYVSELRNVYNPVDMTVIGQRSDMTFGFGRTWDASLGFRFP